MPFYNTISRLASELNSARMEFCTNEPLRLEINRPSKGTYITVQVILTPAASGAILASNDENYQKKRENCPDPDLVVQLFTIIHSFWISGSIKLSLN